MENNTKIFIEYFGKLEAELSEIVKKEYNGNHLPFYEKIDKSSNHSAVVKKYANQLRTFGDLRNILAHNDNRDIAVPSNQTIKEIKYIHNLLIHPLTAFHIAQRKVEKFEKDTPLVDVLRAFNKERYSQYPIYDQGQFEGLLTDNGISYWLSNQLSEPTISLKDIKVEDVLIHDQKKANYKFIPSTMDIYEVETLFDDIHREALFVTDDGNPNQKILGIITRSDILQQRE